MEKEAAENKIKAFRENKKIQLVLIAGIFILVFIFFKIGFAEDETSSNSVVIEYNVRFEGIEADQPTFAYYYPWMRENNIPTPFHMTLDELTYNTSNYSLPLSGDEDNPTTFCNLPPGGGWDPSPNPLPRPIGIWGRVGGYIDTPPINVVEDIDTYYWSDNFINSSNDYTKYTDIINNPVNKAANPQGSAELYEGPEICSWDERDNYDTFQSFCEDYCVPRYENYATDPTIRSTQRTRLSGIYSPIIQNNKSGLGTPYLDYEFGLPTYMVYYPSGTGTSFGSQKCMETQVNCDRTVTLTVESLSGNALPIQCILSNVNDPSKDQTCSSSPSSPDSCMVSVKGKDLSLSCSYIAGRSGEVKITLKTDFNCFLYLGRSFFAGEDDMTWLIMWVGGLPGLCPAPNLCWCQVVEEFPHEEGVFFPLKLTDPSSLPPTINEYYLDIPSHCGCTLSGPGRISLGGNAYFTLTYTNMGPGTPTFEQGSPVCGNGAGLVGDIVCSGDNSGTCTFTCENYNTTVGSPFDVSAQIENNLILAECETQIIVGGQPPFTEGLTVGSENYCLGDLGGGVVPVQWVYRDPDGDTESKFDIQIDDNSDFSSPEVDITVDNLSNPDGFVNSQLIQIRNQLTFPGIGYLTYGKSYRVQVRVWDSTGQNSGWVVYGGTITTDSRPWPYPNFEFSPANPEVSQEVAFTDISLCYDTGRNQYSCEDGISNIYTWLFGDGDGNSDRGDTSHTYSATGNYNATLRICYSSGECCSFSTPVPVGGGASQIPEWKEITPF